MKDRSLVTRSRRTMMAPAVAFALLTLQVRFTAVVDAQCSVEEVLTDSCPWKVDLECDAGGVLCPAGTDCFDCDPCRV